MWDQRYGSDDYVYGTEPNDFLRQMKGYIPADGRVLCLADGEGRNGVFLAQQGYAVTSVDQSAVGLHKAQQLATQRGVSISTVTADLATFELGSAVWDGVVSIYAHLPAALRRELHARVVGALRPGGVIILEAYTRRQLEMPGVGGPPASRQDAFMSLAELRQELAGLELVHGVETEREVNEGKFHGGLSAVVQVVGRKPG